MKKQFSIYFLTLISLFLSQATRVYAQDETRNFMFSIEPQSIIFKGIKMDLDTRIRNSRVWLMVAPQYYFNENELTESQYDDKTTYSKLNGGGVDVSLRYYLKKDNQIPRGFYTSFIVSYQNFNLEFPEYKWMKYTRNGLEYIDYSLVDEKVTINRMNAGVTIGFMATISGVAFFDFYIGYGGRKSDLKTRSGIETEKFQERIWDYGYSGINMLLGMRIGLMF